MNRDPIGNFDEKTFEREPGRTTGGSFDDVKERVSDAAAKTKERAGQMAESVSERLDQQRENAAEGLGRMASTIHDKARNLPGGPRVVHFTHRLADGMESTAVYLRESDFAKMGDDLLTVCRKYPTQSLVVALTAGFLLGRSARR